MFFKNIIGKDRDIVEEFNKEVCLLRDSTGDSLCLEKGDTDGYVIEKREHLVTVRYKDISYLSRAVLRIAAEDTMEEKIIAQGRGFRDFGVMLDVSRNAVLKVETVKRFMRLAALMGYAFVGLYMEDTLKIDGEPYWGYQRGAYTEAEIKELDQYGRFIGIELRPYIQTLAHVNQVFRYESYRDIMDAEDILLVGEERTEKLLDHLIGTVAHRFSTSQINIGMDEAYLVGRGKYIEKNGYTPRKEIMQKHLALVLDLCRKYGLKPQMWSDMFFGFSTPEQVSDSRTEGVVPEGVEIAYWDYYSQDVGHYDERLKAHRKLSDRVAFAGGAWKWSGLVPHNRFSMKANDAAIEACKKNHISSFTITCWGDDGAEASCFSILPTLYRAAEKVYGDAIPASAFELLTGIPIEEYLQIDDGNPYAGEGNTHNNSSKYLLYNDPLYGTFDSVIPNDITEEIQNQREKIKKVLDSGKCRFGYVFETEKKLLDVIEQKATLGKRIRTLYEKKDKERLRETAQTRIPELQERIEDLYCTFKKQWNIENKSYGFEIQAIRIGGLKQRLKDVKEMLDGYVQRDEPIEVLEEKQIPFSYCTAESMESLNYNLWSHNVTPNVIG